MESLIIAHQKPFITMVLLCLVFSSKSQTLSIPELISLPFAGPEKTDSILKSKGWTTHNLEFVGDSNLIRKTWSINNKYNDLKSYVQYWEYTQKPEENHIAYQMSERKAFELYVKELKKLGYKEFNGKRKKKKKKGDPNLYKEQDEPFINEKTNSLVDLRTVFLYGMNSFMIFSYKAESRTAKILFSQGEKEKDKDK
ncbi:MAG: hypothetical protein ACXVNQ_02335 [Bacteroidia bacterium]